MAAMELMGRKLLREVEEGSLEDLLRDLRNLNNAQNRSPPARLGLPTLDSLWATHGSRLEITGPGALPLLYHIVSTAVSSTDTSARNGTVIVIDLDGRFDVSRLSCQAEDLMHVHVLRVSQKGRLREALESVEGYLLGNGGKNGSMGREWVGTCVNGRLGGDVCVGWRGWLRVESTKFDVEGFGAGMSVEEAMRERERRQEVVDVKSWRALSEWGEYRFKES